ncbi:hypothetical protein D3C72_1465890 [compost metagenome]
MNRTESEIRLIDDVKEIVRVKEFFHYSGKNTLEEAVEFLEAILTREHVDEVRILGSGGVGANAYDMVKIFARRWDPNWKDSVHVYKIRGL